MKRMLRACAWLLASAAVAAAGETPELATRIEADLFAREGADILYAIGHVRLQRGRDRMTADGAVVWLRDQEAYLEGRVVYRVGKSVMKAERAYVHWTTVKDPETGEESTKVDRSFIVRGDVQWNERPDRVPWRIRAEEVLQTDVNRILARGHVILSTCLYHEPHVYFRASEVVLVRGDKIIIKNLSYQVQGVALDPDIQGWWIPPIYWPYLYIPLGWEWPEMRFEAGSKSRYGFYVQTEVLYPILAEDATPLGVPKVGVRMDYYAKRGFAHGMSFEYERGDGLMHGRAEFWRLGSDDGEDRDRYEITEDDRYRWKFIHSQDMPAGWEFDFEFQKHSDAAVRSEFFESEFYTDKPVENRIYLKRYEGPFAGYIHARWQEDEWLDTTEYLPQIGVNVISYPLAPHLIYTGHFEVARIRRRLSDLRLAPGDAMGANNPTLWDVNFYNDPLRSTTQEALSDDQRFWRLNTYHELAMPFDVGFLNVEPFVGVRGTYYSETIGGDSSWRTLAVWGGRVSAQFWNTWDDVRADGLRVLGAKILPLEIDGLRHIITPEIRILSVEDSGLEYDDLILTDDDGEIQPAGDYRYAGYRLFAPPGFAGLDGLPFMTDPGLPAGTLVSRPRLYYGIDPTTLAFGDVHDIAPFRVLNVALRNRWQTQRKGRVVDLIDLDVDLDFFFGDKGVSNGENYSDLRVDFRFRPADGITFFMDFDHNIGSNSYLRRDRDTGEYSVSDDTFSTFNTGLYVHTSRRWQVVLTQRYGPDEGNRVGFRFVYHPDDKWRVMLQHEYNTKRSDPIELGVVISRDMHDWIAEFIIEADEISDENLIGFRLQPKLRRQLITGLYYTRTLGANIDRLREEAYQHYDY